MKPGYKTTEFYLSLVATLAGLIMASGLVTDGSTIGKVIGVVMSVLAQLGYTYHRSQLKKGE